jgi:hypothetical protein
MPENRSMESEGIAMEKHAILVDGQVIYEGDDWQRVFFEAAKNNGNGTIEHTINGKTGAMMGPTIRHTGGIAPFLPPVQSVIMHHPAFVRGYNDGLATIEPAARRMTDDELVSLLKTLFESRPTQDDCYYHIGNIIGVMNAQTQHTLYRVISVYEAETRRNEAE